MIIGNRWKVEENFVDVGVGNKHAASSCSCFRVLFVFPSFLSPPDLAYKNDSELPQITAVGRVNLRGRVDIAIPVILVRHRRVRRFWLSRY
ncbi:hypothetical protein Q31b_41570 [Novipirellula aureliae]|uniref:Uncharacterized protein n=1 Tax=Novipirellula aureliae TaxID=2527966 RepID=A0A5C6DS50_9BACT|nr:hypothetical protein Q31b_41570 [Novipirellula aureliae]